MTAVECKFSFILFMLSWLRAALQSASFIFAQPRERRGRATGFFIAFFRRLQHPSTSLIHVRPGQGNITTFVRA